jgi:hypothetical protein
VAVDVETMLIVATAVSQHTNDKRQVEPMLAEIEKLPEVLGKPEALLADTGYFSADNIRACCDQKIEPLIAMGCDSHHVPLVERLAPDAPEPKTTDPVEKMAWEFKTKERRKVRPAPPSAKPRWSRSSASSNGSWDSASSRFEDWTVTGEGKLVALAFNLKRMHVLAAVQ